MHEYVYSLGATNACGPCYTVKSETYRGCQMLPAGSPLRETCFRAADAAFGACLDACGGSRASSGLLLLGAGAAALLLLG